MKRKIIFITGTRADFGKLKPLIIKVEESEKLESYIFATGMHMLLKYGSTYDEIIKSGFKNIFPYINQCNNSSSDMDIVLSNTVQGLGHYIREILPDLIVVHGDRVEAMAGALVGALNNILVAHIEGGELSGTVDELIRHSITKLSHVHFTANEDTKKRLMQMGEIEASIYIIGSADIDVMMSNDLPEFPEVQKKYEIDFNNYYIFLYHPVTTEIHDLKAKIEAIIDALIASNSNYVCIYPNNDKGSDIILESLRQVEDNQKIRLIPSMRFEFFLSLLKHSKGLIGNSSAGIREAPVYGIPTINIGSRQNNRFQYESIFNIKENKKEILKTLQHLPVKVKPSHYFGNGKSAEKFIMYLNNQQIWKLGLQKQFKDL